MNGLTTATTNNVIPNNINQQQLQQQQQHHAKSQQQQMAQGNSLTNVAGAKDQQQQRPQLSTHQLHYQPQIISNEQITQPHSVHKLGGLLNDKQQQQQQPPLHVNNLMNNNNMGQPPSSHFQHQGPQQPQHPNQQRFMMQQQQNHFNSHMQAQAHPLAMIGGMMETANQQHQQQMQAQQQRMQLNASNNMINSIDNILGSGTTVSKPTPPPLGTPEHMKFLQQQQQQQQMPPHMQNMSMQQQQHLLMQQQQGLLSGSTTPTSNMGLMPNSATTPTGNSSANASFEHDDEGLSHDDDDEDHENDTNDGMETKPQLIDGGSSSSTSLQAPSGGASAGTPGTKKEKPSYNCLLCPKSYRKRKSLLDHYKIHPGYCHDCGKPNGTSLEVSY